MGHQHAFGVNNGIFGGNRHCQFNASLHSACIGNVGKQSLGKSIVKLDIHFFFIIPEASKIKR